MQPGSVDLLTKEIVALAVSVTNSCRYCINSHTAAVQKLGLSNQQLGEVLAVIGLFNQMNKLADAYQIEPDIFPKRRLYFIRAASAFPAAQQVHVQVRHRLAGLLLAVDHQPIAVGSPSCWPVSPPPGAGGRAGRRPPRSGRHASG